MTHVLYSASIRTDASSQFHRWMLIWKWIAELCAPLGFAHKSKRSLSCHLSILSFFESLGIAQPKGVLLYGPPGTGIARVVAHHTNCTFIRVSGSELVQKYIGEGSRMGTCAFNYFHGRN
ncbi:hypothetical protein MKW98_027359 [Papaver atlanticum]|uniref:ATPase AAA-type core domain-containing protein n=1 Tax=Papaver atlanticum TaxID=357466 RepID=A0AAD4XPD9_9MAGN|nr:hypothetical protein MKW98_027359 [Papaver atlanticum]